MGCHGPPASSRAARSRALPCPPAPSLGRPGAQRLGRRERRAAGRRRGGGGTWEHVGDCVEEVSRSSRPGRPAAAARPSRAARRAPSVASRRPLPAAAPRHPWTMALPARCRDRRGDSPGRSRPRARKPDASSYAVRQKAAARCSSGSPRACEQRRGAADRQQEDGRRCARHRRPQRVAPAPDPPGSPSRARAEPRRPVAGTRSGLPVQDRDGRDTTQQWASSRGSEGGAVGMVCTASPSPHSSSLTTRRSRRRYSRVRRYPAC